MHSGRGSVATRLVQIPPLIYSVVLERRFTKFSEITQCNVHYADQGHSRSPIWVPIKAHIQLAISDLTFLLSSTVSKLRWLLVKFSQARTECLTLAISLGVTPANIAIYDISLNTRFCGLHLRCRKNWCIFNHVFKMHFRELKHVVAQQSVRRVDLGICPGSVTDKKSNDRTGSQKNHKVLIFRLCWQKPPQ